MLPGLLCHAIVSSMMTGTDHDFARTVEQAHHNMSVMAGMQAMMSMFSAYQASAASGSATRQSLGAMGLTETRGPSSRLTPSERRAAEVKANAAKLGFGARGRFVGARRAA